MKRPVGPGRHVFVHSMYSRDGACRQSNRNLPGERRLTMTTYVARHVAFGDAGSVTEA